MSTSYLNFTKDPERDITTASSDYHNFNGNTVRIKVYWTTEIWQGFKLWSQSLHLVRFADALLRKYTLGLDVRPGGAPIAVHAAMRAKWLINSREPSVPRSIRRLQRRSALLHA